jgi:hypothetical protein
MSDVIQWVLLKECPDETEAQRCQDVLQQAGIDSQAVYEDGTPVYPAPQARGGAIGLRVERWNVTKARHLLKDAGIPVEPAEE